MSSNYLTLNLSKTLKFLSLEALCWQALTKKNKKINNNNNNNNHVLVKLDFLNAFNTVRRDTILNSTSNKTPELYRLVHASLACNPTVTYGTKIIKSKEGSQHGDPLSSLEYCDAVQPTFAENQLADQVGIRG